jgi:methylmalonyl-CoA mutase N-terminal domain/subunit
MKDLGATDPKALMLRFHTQTGGSTLTAQQPLNNIARVTVQTLAAVLGGTQSLHTNGYDEALSLPTEAAARIALRTQQVVAFESGAADTADPLAGSFFVESLTREVEAKALELIQKLDGMGGSVAAIESGFMQNEIARSAYQHQRSVEQGEKIIVGVNKFAIEKEEPVPPFRINDNIRQQQTEKLQALKARRDAKRVTACLQAIQQKATTGENLMPAVIEAVEAHCTLGEISDVLRVVFGEFR